MEDPNRSQMQIANVQHNPLYSFENPFGTPFDTPMGENILTNMHPEEIKCRLEEKAHENERLMEAIYARERGDQQAEPKTHTYHEETRRGYYSNPFEHIPLSGNGGNHTLPRTPRVNMEACPSPPRKSQLHHESDDETTSKDVIKFQQDEIAQKLMLKYLEQNGDQYFQYMTAKG